MSATIKELIQSEIADFCAGLGNPAEPVKPKQLQSHLMSRILPLLDVAEKAEAELAALAAQKPVAYRWEGEATGRICYDGVKPLRVASQELFTRAAPVPPVPALKLPDEKTNHIVDDALFAGMAGRKRGFNECLAEVKRLNGVKE